MKTASFTFLILEENGNIDEETRQLEIVEGFTQAGRFVSLFEGDQFHRVARVLVNGRHLVTFDSVLNRYLFAKDYRKH